MKISSAIAGAALASTAAAQYYALGYNQNSWDTTGVAGRPAQTRFIRKDITTISPTGYEFSLLTWALYQMKRDPVRSVYGYASVAGIHGLPYDTWDNEEQAVNGVTGGMCPHGESSFAIWHRPYLKCFELRLQRWALEACQYAADSMKAQCTQIANQIALPYWNWLGPIPSILLNPWITIMHPHTPNRQMQLPNPWYNYTMPSELNFARPRIGGRMVASYRDTNWAAQMNNMRPTLKSQVRTLFDTRCADYNCACTNNQNQWRNRNGCGTPSIEGIHNSIHVGVGGSMNSLDLSSYDPIFWLHHCFVDLIWEIWQRINEGCPGNTNYLSGAPLSSSLYQMRQGTAQTQNMLLRPFKADPAYRYIYTPNHVAYGSSLYYQYDKVRDMAGRTGASAETWALAWIDSISTSRRKRSIDLSKRQASASLETIKDTISNLVPDVGDKLEEVAKQVLKDSSDVKKTIEQFDDLVKAATESEKAASGLTEGELARKWAIQHTAPKSLADKYEAGILFLYTLVDSPEKEAPTFSDWSEAMVDATTIGNTILSPGMKGMNMGQVTTSINIDGAITRLITGTKVLNGTSDEQVIPVVAAFVRVTALTMTEAPKDITSEIITSDDIEINLVQTNVTEVVDSETEPKLDLTDLEAVKKLKEEYMKQVAAAAAGAEPTTTGTATASATESASATPEPDTDGDENNGAAAGAGASGSSQDTPATDDETTGQQEQASTNAGSSQAETADETSEADQ